MPLGFRSSVIATLALILSLLVVSIHGEAAYDCDTTDIVSDFVHAKPVPGMHIVCFHAKNRTITFYAEAYDRSGQQLAVEPDLDNDWNKLGQIFGQVLGLRPSDEMRQPWAVFSPTGERLIDESTLHPDGDIEFNVDLFWNELGMVVIFQGGQWLWPGVRIGFTRQVTIRETDDTTRNVTLETLSLKPLVVSVEGFLTDEECDMVQDLASPKMRFSEVSLMDHDKGKEASEFRTSQSTFVSATPDRPLLINLDHKTASLSRVPRTHQEHVQVLRYEYGQYYTFHNDYFNPAMYENDPYTLNLIKKGRRNRFATVFWYMSDVEEGGETSFPLANGGSYPHNVTHACEMGLQVKPQRGKVIIFYNMKPNGRTDHDSLHAACPVQKGIKWAANKWIWSEEMHYVR